MSITGSELSICSHADNSLLDSPLQRKCPHSNQPRTRVWALWGSSSQRWIASTSQIILCGHGHRMRYRCGHDAVDPLLAMAGKAKKSKQTNTAGRYPDRDRGRFSLVGYEVADRQVQVSGLDQKGIGDVRDLESRSRLPRMTLGPSRPRGVCAIIIYS